VQRRVISPTKESAMLTLENRDDIDESLEIDRPLAAP
jgi:hypothetical protein